MKNLILANMSPAAHICQIKDNGNINKYTRGRTWKAMKRIVCELCEGTQFTKEGGFFVCHGCGTKYSLEEAKSMMREVEGEPEPFVGTPVVAAPVGNPNQAQIDNILVLATTAYEAQNYAEAENYCNRAIELDAMCYKAWNLKGKAVGWQSKIDNLRIEEAAHSFCKAIDFAPEEEKEDVKNQAVEELKKLGLALIALRKQRFAGNPVAAELNGFQNDRKVMLSSLLVLLSHGNAVGMPEGYPEEIAKLMTDAARDAFSMAKKAWSSVDYPTEKDLVTYLDWLGNCESLLKNAIDASDDDDDADIGRYQLLIQVVKDPIGKYSYTRQWNSYSSSYQNVRDKCLNNESVSQRNRLEREYNDKISTLRKKSQEKKEAAAKKAEEEKRARIKAYWEAHADEKVALESEKESLLSKRSSIKAELDKAQNELDVLETEMKTPVPSEVEAKKIDDRLKEIDRRMMSLGMFAGREKKQLNDERTTLYGRRDALKDKITEETSKRDSEIAEKLAPAREKRDEIAKQLDTVDKRIAAIDRELTKDPE